MLSSGGTHESFYTYHSASIAIAIVSADALTVLNHVAHASHLLSIGHVP